MQALALLAPGRCPRAEEERPESSNIHPGVAGPWAGSVPGTATWEPLAPSSSPPQPWADPCPLGRSSRRGSSPPDQGGNHGADSALGLQALQVQPAEGAGALLGSPPPLEQGQAQAVWPALGTHLLGHSPVPWHCHPQRMPPQMPSGLSPTEQCSCLVSLISAPQSRALWASAPASQLWV